MLKCSKQCYIFHCLFAALDICPIDTKALYRRCLALEQTERHEDAYRDARKLIQLDPKNTAIQPVLRRLHAIIQDKVSAELADVISGERVTTQETLTQNSGCVLCHVA